MQTSRVDVSAADGVADAYVAQPDDGAYPGVLFIMDAFGLRPTIEEMVERIAADGYVVLAPNVFYRAGPSRLGPAPDLRDPARRASFFQSLRPLTYTMADTAAYNEGARERHFRELHALLERAIGRTRRP